MSKRTDAIGFFWEDLPVVKKSLAKAKIKRLAPERTWEAEDYLPGLDEALNYQYNLLSNSELLSLVGSDSFIYDIESYPNYFLIAFKSLKTGKNLIFEMDNNDFIDTKKLEWVMQNFCTIGFNSINYDLPITAIALTGVDTFSLNEATEAIIVQNQRPQDVLRNYSAKKLQVDHIDLIEVAPLKASLKIYGGRIHCEKMQDLPFVAGSLLTTEKQAIVKYYCINDLNNTELLYKTLYEQIQLRVKLSSDYLTDLRSKSDAQIAEAIFQEELLRINGFRTKRPVIAPGTVYKFEVPYFIRFKTDLLNWVLNVIKDANYVVGEDGAIQLPTEVKALRIEIAGNFYQLGLGGLHSCEKSISHYADEKYLISDHDVASYYPRIILNQSLYPKHLGINFLKVLDVIVKRRLQAKAEKQTVDAEGLKIVVNGTFGKTSEKYSIIYSPDLTIQTTITGQLALLMLIEELELNGFRVLSANTDGVVTKAERTRYAEYKAIIKDWEFRTNFDMEETQYKSVHSRDVNNYIAVKLDNDAKLKGAYGKENLKKNPTNRISSIAVEKFLIEGIPIEKTIEDCKDITKFISVRTVKGGAVKNGVYLGKAIRWYYAENEETEIVYAINGNKVPRTEGAKPLMELPKEFPTDVNYAWYIQESNAILADIGVN
jgi:hypothetical protein